MTSYLFDAIIKYGPSIASGCVESAKEIGKKIVKAEGSVEFHHVSKTSEKGNVESLTVVKIAYSLKPGDLITSTASLLGFEQKSENLDSGMTKNITYIYGDKTQVYKYINGHTENRITSSDNVEQAKWTGEIAGVFDEYVPNSDK